MSNPKEVAYDALREMYSEAEPPLDLDNVLDNPDDYEDDWFSNHYLDSERQKEIVDKHRENNNLSKKGHSQVVTTAILNYGPSLMTESNE